MSNAYTRRKPAPIRLKHYELRIVLHDWTTTSEWVWVSRPPVDRFNELIAGPDVRHGTMKHGKRVLCRYDAHKEAVARAPLGDNRGFSLIR